MMNGERKRYTDAVNRLLSLADFERKSRANQPPDWHLGRVERLMEMLGEPHLATPVVHVAGSKGKGSTCAMIASGLKAAGFNTGLYTSPHLHTFTERIQVNGENISRSDFAGLIDRLWPCVDAIEQAGDLGVVSVFEMLTAMAFVHFREHADIAIIETGLGGRLDATNVVVPEVAVITSISLDHVRILGDKISLIAREKAGIIKPNSPTVVARNHPAAWQVIREQAATIGSEPISACATISVSDISRWSKDEMRQEFVIKRWRNPWRGRNLESNDEPVRALFPLPDPGLMDVKIRTKLLGNHQIDNARTAAATLNVLYAKGHQFDVNTAIGGISDTNWPCRAETLDLPDWPLIVLDGAHNDASMKALRDAISNNMDLPFVLIIGATEGHDHETMTREFAASAVSVIATQSRHPKSVPAARFVDVATEYGLIFEQSKNVTNALHQAASLARQRADIGLIVVTGSLFVAAEAREYLLNIEPEIYEDLTQPYMSAYQSEPDSKDRIS